MILDEAFAKLTGDWHLQITSIIIIVNRTLLQSSQKKTTAARIIATEVIFISFAYLCKRYFVVVVAVLNEDL